jgi:nicotinamidase-related amidase
MSHHEHTALVVIDVQEKLFRVMHHKEQLLDSMIRMVKGAQVLGLPIVWAEQYPKGMGKTLPQLVELLPGAPIEKLTFSCCQHPPLAQAIADTGADRFLLMGIEAHVCVYQTARDLLAQGHHVEVVADCVSSRTEANRRVGLERLAQEGARITSVEMALFDLLHRAEGEAFRAILPIVK